MGKMQMNQNTILMKSQRKAEVVQLVKKTPKRGQLKILKRTKRKRRKKIPTNQSVLLSGYFLFMADERNKVREEHPDWKTGEIGKELGKRWNTLDANRKKKYQDQADKAKAKYDKEMEAYNKQ